LIPPKNAFNHIRLIAAVLVLVSHHFALWGLPEPGILGRSLGHVGIAIFFSLSGFLVTKSFEADPHAGRFLLRRALRIMPGLVVNVIICVGIFGVLLTNLPFESYVTHPMTRAFFKNILFNPTFQLPGVLEDARHPYAVNGSLWTLPFEAMAYLVLVTIGVIFRKSLTWLSPILIVIGLFAVLRWHPESPIILWGNDLRHAPLFLSYFFVGVALYFFAPVLLTLSKILMLSGLYVILEHPSYRDVVAILLVPCLSIYIGRQFISPVLELKNDCSFGVYLYAFPVQQFVITKFGSFGFWPTLLLSILTTYALSIFSWKLIEKPMLKLKPARSSLSA
jgi:peptidoglycan/LPS O-acetylase OafA/YrhL